MITEGLEINLIELVLEKFFELVALFLYWSAIKEYSASVIIICYKDLEALYEIWKIYDLCLFLGNCVLPENMV